MDAEDLARAISANPKMIVHLVNASDEIKEAARTLLACMDAGYLNYKPDVPESSAISALRRALARASE